MTLCLNRYCPGWGEVDINVFGLIHNWIGLINQIEIILYDKLILIRNFHRYEISVPSM